MMKPKQEQVILYNGKPKICIQKMKNGAYRWVTKESGVMTHSLLSQAIYLVKNAGYTYHINETPKSYDED